MSRLPPLPTIQEIIRIYGLSARKKLSQNFLLDLNLTNKIVRSAGKLDGGIAIEVGPGPGGITRSLLNTKAAKVVAIEKDRRFIPSLQILAAASGNRVDVVCGDILGFNMHPYLPPEFEKSWKDSPPNVHIIGNLPFNVSTPLVIQWLRSISTRSNIWSSGRCKLTLTFQKEVAERIVAPPKSEHRCRLSVMCQHLCDVKLKFTIPGKAFVPPPKVDVGIVTFEPKIEPLIKQPFHLVEKVCRHLFHYPNKYCIRGVSTLFPPDREDLVCEIMEMAKVQTERRPFELSIDNVRSFCDSYAILLEREEDLAFYNFRSERHAKERRRGNMHLTGKLEAQLLSSCENNDSDNTLKSRAVT